MLNNNPISSLYEIYDAVTNDCYIYLFSLCFQNVRDSIVKYISEKEKENPTLNIISKYYHIHTQTICRNTK